MKKLKQKSNAKPVGAGLVPAQNKGITLIALIITIVLNCSYLAMVEVSRIIENRENLLYNRLCS